MINSTLQSILDQLTACIPGADSTKMTKMITYCDSTPYCDSYLTVSSPGVRFAREFAGPAGDTQYCASIIMLPVTIRLAGVCIPTMGSSGQTPSQGAVDKATKAAYQQMENLAICLFEVDLGFCTYRTLPELTCDTEGSSYVVQAGFELTLNCLEKEPTGASCC